ncbi:MAG TPA: hypothetical protein VLZ03_14415, partial [Thermodesulfobacteriota bacterium]|nr:hypothetical protein [Thermodesulfobacteriota bacterium]
NHQKGMKVLDRIKLIRNLVLSGDKIHILVDDPEKGEKTVREVLGEQHMEILDLVVVRPSLEDAFVSIVQRKTKASS